MAEGNQIRKESTEEIGDCFDRLWPLLRSITGDGVRQTHDILGELIPLNRYEIPTDTQVHDWTIPKEWVIREAYVIDPSGKRILDIKDNNLHLVNYSIPFDGEMTLEELDKHLYSIPEQPNAIPYVCSYYKPRWGFCLSHEQRVSLKNGTYKVYIDSEHIDGSLTYSDCLLEGESDREILISTYTCHPSMANNELSGPLVSAFLYRRLAQLSKRRYTYRFVFVPETIGAIAYLSRHGDHLREKLHAGYVLTCLGDAASFTVKKSRRGNTSADIAALSAIGKVDPGIRVKEYYPSGSDERQYCSPGYDFPVVTVSRSMLSDYSEYHTSLDNREFISFDALSGSVDALFEVCELLERNLVYRNTVQHGEPCLSKRELLPDSGVSKGVTEFYAALQWLSNLADGKTDLLTISERSGIDLNYLDEIAGKCVSAGLFVVES